MKTIYFTSNESAANFAAELEANGETCTKSSMNCDCGESFGYYCDTHKLIVCEECYNNADHSERGE